MPIARTRPAGRGGLISPACPALDAVRLGLAALVGLAGVGCGDNGAPSPDAGPAVTTEHCAYVPVPATAGAGGAVSAGALEAGAAELVLDIPVSTALGAYTGRAAFLGASGSVDRRKPAIAGGFNASIGVETAPRVKVLALSAGGETVLLVKLDLGLVYEGMLFDLEERLGEAYRGKVILAASHSHSAWAQQTASDIFKVGLGEFRWLVYQRTLDQLEAAARAALAARRPARLGVHREGAFDPADEVTRDRRGENDELMGGPRKDDTLFMLRVDGTDGAPIAAVPVFGIHGTISSEDNLLASVDAPGYVERLLEERIGGGAIVIHLQGAGADVSPTGHGAVDCSIKPGRETDPCYEWLRAEGTGRAAVAPLHAAWTAAGEAMEGELALEMVTRSIELGPHAETFSVRGGQLAYAPFDLGREADREVRGADGALLSPIDEFNAPVGAALCEGGDPLFPGALMPGVDGLAPYGSCVRLDVAAPILGDLIELDLPIDETHPSCQGTRTTISALRVGEHLIATVPGELSLLLAERLRAASPVEAGRTVLVGYAQGHIGYCMTADDWVLGGYESSINGWGPLEAELVGERLAALMPLALSAERDDGAAGGTDRVATPEVDDGLAVDDPAPGAGTVPAVLPDDLWVRTGALASAQPDAEVPRVSGHATFAWIGEDPLVATPVVTLERESAPGSGEFAPVVRASGRPVRDGDLLLTYTPIPLRREGDEPQTHHWAVEWQAVGWIGMAGQDPAEVAGLGHVGDAPLGRYRFHVAGHGYELASEPFEVVPAVLEVTVARGEGTLAITPHLHAPRGYRLLDLAVPSNRPVPLRNTDVTIRLIRSAGPDLERTGTTDAAGTLVTDDPGDVIQVEVTTAAGTGSSPI